MSHTDQPIETREFKVMLNTDRFPEWKIGVKSLARVVGRLAKETCGNWDRTQDLQDDVKRRATHFLDTPGHDFRRNDFVLRVRKADSGDNPFKVTLKFRSFDRYLSAAADISHVLDHGDSEKKFEEDVTPPGSSRFSYSKSLEDLPAQPPMTTLAEVKAVFPGLGAAVEDVGGTTGVAPVNGFIAHETVVTLGEVILAEEEDDCGRRIKADVVVTLWHGNSKRRGYPLVAECSFDHKMCKSSDDDDQNRQLERLPVEAVLKARKLFGKLSAREGWVKPNATTKTRYAYERA